MIEIRYDSLKYDESSMIRDLYGKIVQQCIEWIKNKLKVDLFVCKYDSIVDVIKYNQEGDVKIYKQMMELS